MENSLLGCESLTRMPALSNSDQKNGPSTSTTSELFCQINDPEDVGAIGKKYVFYHFDGKSGEPLLLKIIDLSKIVISQ